MRSEIARAVVLALALSLSLSACGLGAKNTKAGRADCEKQCDIEMMNCLETRTCTDLGGHREPCLAECQTELFRCEQTCGDK